MFILVMGVTGSGKTTIGTLLSAAMGCPFYDADDFHSPENVHKMASGVPLSDEDRGPWLQELHELISRHNERGENGVLACSALKAAYRRILSADADVAVVYLKAHPDLIRSRLDSRSGHYMPQRLIGSQFLDLEEPKEGIIIDAAWPPEQIVETIRSELARLRGWA
jgi:gluconokinase